MLNKNGYKPNDILFVVDTRSGEVCGLCPGVQGNVFDKESRELITRDGTTSVPLTVIDKHFRPATQGEFEDFKAHVLRPYLVDGVWNVLNEKPTLKPDHIATGTHTNGKPWSTPWIMRENIPNVFYTVKGPYPKHSNPFGNTPMLLRDEYCVTCFLNDAVTNVMVFEQTGRISVGTGDFGFEPGTDLDYVFMEAAKCAYARAEGFQVCHGYTWWDTP